MSRNIEFDRCGLNILKLGSDLSQFDSGEYDNISNNELIRTKGLFNGYFDYYFLKKHFVLNDTIGIKDLFFASDKRNKICGIFIIVKEYDEMIIANLEKIFGAIKLKSESGIGNKRTSSKTFWQMNDISVF